MMLTWTCRIEYAPERPEWEIEKHRFYVELPGLLPGISTLIALFESML